MQAQWNEAREAMAATVATRLESWLRGQNAINRRAYLTMRERLDRNLRSFWRQMICRRVERGESVSAGLMQHLMAFEWLYSPLGEPARTAGCRVAYSQANFLARSAVNTLRHSLGEAAGVDERLDDAEW